MDYYKIGQQVRKFRKLHLYSQEDLAEKVGISVTHMSHIETGNTKLSLPVLVSLIKALEIRADDLLFPRDHINRNSILDDLAEALEDCSAQELRIIAMWQRPLVLPSESILNRYRTCHSCAGPIP